MFENLSAQVQPVTEQEVLDIFSDESNPAPKGGAVKTDTKGKNQPGDKSKTTPQAKAKPSKTTSSTENTDIVKTKTLTDFSEEVDDVFGGDDEDEDQDDNTEAGKSTKKTVKTDDEDDDNEDESNDEDQDDDTNEDNDDDEDEDENKGGNDETEIKNFIKSRVEFLVKKGEWADYEGREDEDWTEDRFAEVELDQRNYQKQLMTDEILDSFGPIGREIANYTKNGGNPDDLLDIFKEQQRVESFSVETEESQRALVLKYETEFLGKKPERVKKYIDTLIADKELQTYATEAKEAMESALNLQAEELQTAQTAKAEQAQAKQKQAIQKFSSDVNKLVNEDKNIPADEKKELIRILTKYDKKLPNGTPVNEFYEKFAEFRKDLPNYLKLVRLVMNPEKFEKTLKTSGKNDATEKAFKLVRTADKTRKAKSKDITNPGVSKPGTKFRLL